MRDLFGSMLFLSLSLSLSLNDTHRENCVLLNYKNLVKQKLGYFWPFSKVHTIN